MKKVFAVEMKRAINIGWIISILGVCFSICFDSWNDLMRALTSHTGSIHYFFWNSLRGNQGQAGADRGGRSRQGGVS